MYSSFLENPNENADSERLYISRVMQMTPAMVDQQIIAEQRKRLHRIESQEDLNMFSFNAPSAPVDRSYGARLKFLMDLRASQAATQAAPGLGEPMQKRANAY